MKRICIRKLHECENVIFAYKCIWDKTKIWSHVWRRNKPYGRRERREEEEEEEKKKRREEESQAKKVWKLTLIMDSMRLCMNFHAWLVSSLSPNLRFY